MKEAGVVREVRCGSDHTVVAMASGEVCSFGAGDQGQLGHGDEEIEDDFEPIYDIGEPRVVAGLRV